MSLLYPKIVDMFCFAGDKHSTPNCPIELKPDFNPSSGSQSYTHSDPMCLKPAHYNIPFFTSKAGPKSAEWNTGAHETRPGHHLQVLNEQIPLPFIVKCRNMKWKGWLNKLFALKGGEKKRIEKNKTRYYREEGIFRLDTHHRKVMLPWWQWMCCSVLVFGLWWEGVYHVNNSPWFFRLFNLSLIAT